MINNQGILELIGTLNGNTAVASGIEITGIADAVYSTGQAETLLLATAVTLLQENARANYRGQKALGRRIVSEI